MISMQTVYRMPNNLRAQLSRPYEYNKSILFIEGPREYVAFTLRSYLYTHLYEVYVVGDYTCETFLNYIGMPRLCVIDNNVMRYHYNAMHNNINKFVHIFRCSNPQGTISLDCLEKLREAYKAPRSLVIVDGEEDLLALALTLIVPSGFIVFGIPRKGVALINSREGKVDAVNKFSQFVEERM